jgi:hypothetical protein
VRGSTLQSRRQKHNRSQYTSASLVDSQHIKGINQKSQLATQHWQRGRAQKGKGNNTLKNGWKCIQKKKKKKKRAFDRITWQLSNELSQNGRY